MVPDPAPGQPPARVYINLSIWYKLTDRTLMGAWVTLAGSAVTVALCSGGCLIHGYVGAAWAHLACYGTMVALSYLWVAGTTRCPMTYRRVLGYVALGLALYGASRLLVTGLAWPAPVTGTLLLALFLVVVYVLDGRRVWRHPGLGGD